MKLPRMERHNFLCKQVCRLTKKYHPGAIIETKQVFHTLDGGLPEPNIVVTIDEPVVIADVAVA